MKWSKDIELQQTLEEIVARLGMTHINPKQVFCFRTHGSKSRAYARIWSFPKIFQQVLDIKPAYVIEVLSEKYDRLSRDDKIRVIIHELLHIPKNFSGSLLPHRFGHKTIEKEVKRLFKEYNQ